MRCERCKRLISDSLDGSSEPVSRARLEAHLKACPSCREYSLAMARLQVMSREIAPAAPAGEKMVQSMAKLKANLRLSNPVYRKPLSRPNLAWAALSFGLIFSFIGLYLTVMRPGPAIDIIPYAPSDTHSDFVLSLSSDDALAAAFDSAIQSSLGENESAPEAAVEPLAAEAGIFLDSLTDEEVALLDLALQELLAL